MDLKSLISFLEDRPCSVAILYEGLRSYQSRNPRGVGLRSTGATTEQLYNTLAA